MSGKKKVIPYKSLPARLPGWATVVLWLWLDRIKAPGWLWGAAVVLMAIFWIRSIAEWFQQKETEVWTESCEHGED